MAAVAVIVLAWAAALAPGARAATVSLVDAGDVAPGRFALAYRAAPGEANRLTARETSPGRAWSFRDTGAPVVAGPNCAPGAAGTVTCTAPAPQPAAGPPPVNTIVIALGDGDDVIRIAGSRFGATQVAAGSGDDELLVAGGWVQATMGAGDDRARGAGEDLMGGGLRRGGLTVSGNAGADTLSVGGRADVAAMYLGAPRGVRVTLDGRANDGAANERDNVGRGVRTLYGSGHDDVLDARGARHPVTLYGEAGDDRMFASPAGGGIGGGRGDDVVHGGPGRDRIGGDEDDDRLSGGGGDDDLSPGAGRNVSAGGPGKDRYFVDSDRRDVIRARGGGADHVFCQNLPRALEADARDRLTRCAFPVEVVGTPTLGRQRRLHLTMGCPGLAPGGCRATLRLIDTSPRPLAVARVAIGAGGRARRVIRLGHTPRNLLFTAIFVNRRARPPASTRTTVAAFDLCGAQPPDAPGIMVVAPCPTPSRPAASSTRPP